MPPPRNWAAKTGRGAVISASATMAATAPPDSSPSRRRDFLASASSSPPLDGATMSRNRLAGRMPRERPKGGMAKASAVSSPNASARKRAEGYTPNSGGTGRLSP